tara:strand:- start:18041 stop:20998 length:2958 start_codon:yes stop_codon:yes gene_type:complete
MNNLGKLLNIKKDEYSRILFLIIQSLFYGIFISYYNSYISALFLSVFDISYLTYAYLASGVVGIISAYIFSFTIKKFSFKFHSSATLLVISLFILLLKLGINYGYSKESLAFLGFIFFTPITSLITLVFSSLTMQLFDLRQGKRLFSLIASGSVIAAIVSYMTVPLLLNVFSDSSNLLWCALIGVFIGGIIQIIINNKYSDYIERPKETKKENTETKEVKIFKNPYFKSIYVLSILSMFGLILVSYSFLSASKTYFSGFDIKTLGQFFGLFFGITKSIEFIMNTFVSGKLLEKNGLRFGLSTLPISLLILSGLALTFSIFALFYEGLEIITFIVVVLSMLVLIVIKRSLEDSSFKLLFQPLGSNLKSLVQSSTEGKARQLGAILVGASLVAIQFVVNSEYIQIACIILLVFICIYWVKNVKKVSFQYKSFISKELDNIKTNSSNTFQVKNFTRSQFGLERNERHGMGELLLPGFEKFGNSKKINTKNPENHILDSETQKQKEYIDLMKQNWSKSYFNEVIRLLDEENRFVVEYLIHSLESQLKSKEFKTFIATQKIVFSNRLLLLLMRVDYDFSQSLTQLELNLSKASQASVSNNLMAIDVFANTKPKKLERVLLKNLTVKDVEIESRIISALIHKKEKNSESDYLVIKNKIEDEVQNYNRLLASILDLSDDPKWEELVGFMELELKNSTHRIFKLTTLIYDADEISKIINIILDDFSEKKILAIEMVDILFEEELKEYLIPLIDNLDYNEKYLKINNFFPVNRLEPTERLKDIINTQYDRLNIMIRLKAMELISEHTIGSEIPNEIMANIFNTDLLLREGAFYCLSKTSKETFTSYLEKDKSPVKALYGSNDKFSYKKEHLNVFELYNTLIKTNFLDSIPTKDLIKILRITDHTLYTKKSLTTLEGTDFALLVVDGLEGIENFNALDARITQIDELILFGVETMASVQTGLDDGSKLLKIDSKKLIDILMTSEELYLKSCVKLA